MKYITVNPNSDDASDLLAVSTEDGRVIFYSTNKLRQAEEDPDSSIPFAEPVAQLGGRASGYPGRIKDFEVFNLKGEQAAKKDGLIVVTGNSDGAVRIWMLDAKDLSGEQKADFKDKKENASTTRQVGRLLNTYETGNRITCLNGFVMLPSEDPSTLEEDEEDGKGEDEQSEEESSDESDAE